MITPENKLALFKEELNMIKTDRIRQFAEELLISTGDWFYHAPASTSGKYHPSFALGDGGLVRHTKTVAMFLHEFIESTVVTKTQEGHDLLIVAAIAHDIRKHNPETGIYNADHPAQAAAFVRETHDRLTNLVSEPECEFMCSAIESHMSIWDHRKYGTPMPTTISQIALSFADIAASRRYINIDFSYMPAIVDVQEETSAQEEPEQTNDNHEEGK